MRALHSDRCDVAPTDQPDERTSAPSADRPPPEALEGEGLRPNESRDKPLGEEEPSPASEDTPSTPLPGSVQAFVPTRDFPNPPNMPYAPFPYTPYNDIPPN